MSVYVGIDVHRKRSQVAVAGEDGRVQLNRNVVNGSGPMLELLGGLPAGTPVAFEAAFGWGWLAGLLEDYGFQAHLVHPLRCKAIASARLKNDKVDAAILAQLLRADLLPEAWIAPPAVRALRALLRHRIQLVRLRTLLGNRIHAIAADHGYDRPAGYWSGPGRAWLASLDLPPASRQVTGDDLALIDALAGRIAALDEQVHQRAQAEPGVKVLTQLPGVGEFTALVILAEVGDITRFGSARKLASWAGLTPTVRGSGRTVHHGHISKQGSAWLRWALGQAAQTAKRSPDFAATYQAIAARRGKQIATTAIARKLLTRAWHRLTAAGITGPTATPPPRLSPGATPRARSQST
jgi:transposase